MLKMVLMTGSIGMSIGFGSPLWTLFGDGSVRMEYLEVAVVLLLFLVYSKVRLPHTRGSWQPDAV